MSTLNLLDSAGTYSQVLSKQLTVWLVKFVFVGGEGGEGVLGSKV